MENGFRVVAVVNAKADIGWAETFKIYPPGASSAASIEESIGYAYATRGKVYVTSRR